MIRALTRSRLNGLNALRHPGILFVVLLMWAMNTLAGQVSLAWDSSTSRAVAGYMLHYGQVSGNYTNKVDVGKVTSYSASGLLDGATYYYAVTAYDSSRVESAFSNEVSWGTTQPAGLPQPPISSPPPISPPPSVSGCPCSLWTNAAAPSFTADSDTAAVELGVRFQADNNGLITGIRFYKASTNRGAHTGSLWSSDGQLLAQATFVGETSFGWQQVNFASPIAITANTVYVASYHAGSGHYSADNGYFATAGIDNGPLHAPRDGDRGSNGVYAYGQNTAFPSDSYLATNYWVDVIFIPTN